MLVLVLRQIMLAIMPRCAAHLAVRPELKLQELVAELAAVA